MRSSYTHRMLLYIYLFHFCYLYSVQHYINPKNNWKKIALQIYKLNIICQMS